MGRPTSEFYRRIAVGTLDRYTGKDHRVTRDVIGWLSAGTESTRTGVLRIHTGAIAEDLGWPRGQIEAAIQRLASDGLAVWSPAVRVIACAFVVDVLAVFTENHRKSCLNHLDTLPQCDATEYARKVIQAIEITRGEGASNAPYNAPLHGASNGASNGAIRDKGEGRREKGEGRREENKVPAPAVADDSEFPEPDWAAIAATKASAPLSVWEGKLTVGKPEPQPEPEQQALTLSQPSKRELTPAQLDAIFAREQMALWVDEWNKIMAAHNVPATASDHRKLATTLMRSVARLKNEVRVAANPIELLRWVANTKYADYYAGKKGKKWTLKAWLAADNLGLAFTCYREYHDNHDARRQWYWHTDRTLTEWREAVEAEREKQARFRAMMQEEAQDAA